MVKRTQSELEALVKKSNARKPVTPRQARLALLQFGLLPQVESTLAALPEPDKTAVSIEWEYATEIQRDDPWIGSLGAAMGLTDDQLDDLFILAQTI